jgi:hypothetical protein
MLNNFEKNPLHLTIFADERKKLCQDRWDYIGVLIIKTEYIQEFLDEIEISRKEAQYPFALKFTDIGDHPKSNKLHLGFKWIDLISDELTRKKNRIYFKGFGIDNHNLDHSFFDDTGKPSKIYANVYHRFFRTTILGAMKWFFKGQEIIVDNIYHDSEGNLQSHEFFDYHIIEKGINEENISFACERIIFLRSDHNKETDYPYLSHFIQFADFFLGATTQCIHRHNKSSIGQNKIAEKIYPTVKKMMTKPFNVNAAYYKRYDISHFPNEKIEGFDGYCRGGLIYRHWPDIIQNQKSIFDLIAKNSYV